MKELKVKMHGHNTLQTMRGDERFHTTAKSNTRAELLDLLEKNETVILEIAMPYGLGKLQVECDRIYGDNRVIAAFDKDMSLLLQTCELLSKTMRVSPDSMTSREADALWDVFAHVTKASNITDGLPTTITKEETDGDRMDSRKGECLCGALR